MLYEKNKVTKKNELNEMRINDMNLTELRFLSIYLSKIDPRNCSETRIVRFPLSEFKRIMKLSQINIVHMKKVTDSLLQKVINIQIKGEKGENKGYRGFQLFKECVVSQGKYGEWYVEIDAHDKALPLMFDFNEQFFVYKLENILRLSSPNRLRMYELLKQYESAGVRIEPIDKLREMLGIKENEYLRYNNFRSRILDPCQEALAKYTDIEYTYAPHGKRGPGGKVLYLKFTIKKNARFKEQLAFEGLIERRKLEDDNDDRYGSRISLLAEACNNEFNRQDIVLLHGLMLDCEPGLVSDDMSAFEYLHRRYQYLESQSSKRKITHRLGYLKSLIGKEI